LASRLAKKHKWKLAWGTDLMFDPKTAEKQSTDIGKLEKWFTGAEAIRMITHQNAELLALCGKRNPYPGTLGVIEEKALADLLLVDGDPLKDLMLLTQPEKNLLIIMKDGKISKDKLPK
jgi:imidazolonepropionase-like amidohydrolase